MSSSDGRLAPGPQEPEHTHTAPTADERGGASSTSAAPPLSGAPSTGAVPPVSRAPPPVGRGSRRRKVLLALALLLLAFAVLEYVTLPDAGSLEKENPKTTALIEQRAEEARE